MQRQTVEFLSRSAMSLDHARKIVAWAILIVIVLILLFGARVSSYFEKKVNQMNENTAKRKEDVK